jgi:hypothetical protein
MRSILQYIFEILTVRIGRNNSAGTATKLRAGHGIFGGTRDFSLPYSVHTDSDAHTVFYSMGTKGSSPGGKAAEA